MASDKAMELAREIARDVDTTYRAYVENSDDCPDIEVIAEAIASRLEPLVGAAQLRRCVLIHNTGEFVGNWVAVPEEDFDKLRAALEPERKQEGK